MAERHKLSEGGTGVYDLVVVRNVSDKTDNPRSITLRHKRMGDVDIAPGRQRTIPVGIALVNLGNPATRDSGRDRARSLELEYVQRKWGFNRGFMSESAWFEVGQDAITGQAVGPMCPPVECFTLDGERMYFVHDDPDGSKARPDAAQLALSGDDRFLHQTIDELRQQIVRLEDRISAKIEDEDGVPVDHQTAEGVQADAVVSDAVLAALGVSREDFSAAIAAATNTPTDPVDQLPDTPEHPHRDHSAVDAAAEKEAAEAGKPTPTKHAAQTQAERNKEREDLPKPPKEDPPLKKDAPATPKVGGGRGHK